MDARKLLAVFRQWSGRLGNAVHRFRAWWLSELLNLFPEGLLHRGRNVLVVTIDKEIVVLKLKKSNRGSMLSEEIEVRDYSVEAIGRFLNSHGLERADVDIAINLPAESIFCRRLTLPIEANDAIDEIVEQSLLKKTPFKLAEIYCDHVAVKADEENKISIWQWIVKRELVHETLSHLQIGIDSVAMVVANKVGNETAPSSVIKLNPSRQKTKSRSQRSISALAYSAFALAFIAGGAKYWHQQALIDQLETEIAEIKSKTQQVRGMIRVVQEKQNALRDLRLRRESTPMLIDLWEEITRVLPSHTWLTEFRLTEAPDRHEQQITIIGFSAAAPSLVNAVDKSSLFSDAALTAPVFLDPVEKVERFTLQTKVVHSGQVKKTVQQ
jgi:general secretion pathway protein L